MRAFSEVRDVTITVTGAPMSIDAYKAINVAVERLEDQYLKSLDENGVSQGLVDLVAVKNVLTGATPYKIYVFDLTTVFANGAYTFDFVEQAPNVDEATSL